MKLSSFSKVKRNTSSRPESISPVNCVFTQVTVDRSGSMHRFGTSTQKALLKIINEQKSLSSSLNIPHYLSVTSFDCTAKNYIDFVKSSELKTPSQQKLREICSPRGLTCLYDTIIDNIDQIDKKSQEWYNALPNKVKNLISLKDIPRTIIIFTDGEDNKSTSSLNDMKQKILTFRQTGGNAVFMASDQDAVISGTKFGFDEKQCLTIDSNSNSLDTAFNGICKLVRGVSSGTPLIIPESLRRSSSQTYTPDDQDIQNFPLFPQPTPLKRQ